MFSNRKGNESFISTRKKPDTMKLLSLETTEGLTILQTDVIIKNMHSDSEPEQPVLNLKPFAKKLY